MFRIRRRVGRQPLPVLLLRRRFPETVDGITFGVAAALGFTLVETLIR